MKIDRSTPSAARGSRIVPPLDYSTSPVKTLCISIPELVSYLRIEERELKAGGLN
jgi:hypothetical protein